MPSSAAVNAIRVTIFFIGSPYFLVEFKKTERILPPSQEEDFTSTFHSDAHCCKIPPLFPLVPDSERFIQGRIDQVLREVFGGLYAQLFQHFRLANHIATATGKLVMRILINILSIFQL